MEAGTGGDKTQRSPMSQHHPGPRSRGEPHGQETDQRDMEDTSAKKPRGRQKTQRQGEPDRKVQNMKKSRMRARRKKNKGLSCQKDGESVQSQAASQSEDTGKVENVETAIDPPQAGSAEIEAPGGGKETRHLQAPGDHSRHHSETHNATQQRPAVDVQTQTVAPEARSTDTQTPVVVQKSQETQTEPLIPPGGQEDCPVEDQVPLEKSSADVTMKTQDDHTPDTEPREGESKVSSEKQQDDDTLRNQPAENLGGTAAPPQWSDSSPTAEMNANLEKEPASRAADPSTERSGNPADSQVREGGTSVSYASAVRGDGKEGGGRSKADTSQAADRGAKASDGTGSWRSREPPSSPMFTFYIYAVLDKKFRFCQNIDKLSLYYGNGYLNLEMTHFVGLGQQGYLIEARCSVEENYITRGQPLQYQYVVQQRQKEIFEVAERYIVFPVDSTVKELHLYEGFINRLGAGSVNRFFHTGLYMFGLKKSKGEEFSDAWHSASVALLERIFQKWTTVDKESTEALCRNLEHFQWSFSSSRQWLFYPDQSHPSVVKVSELIANRLLGLINDAQTTTKNWMTTNPLLLGLSVFMVSRKCQVDLGVKGWADLCRLLSSDATLVKNNMEDLLRVSKTPQFTVLGVMNHCAQQMVPELLLLVPLLHNLQQPGADAARLGPTVEEEDWSGLRRVQFSNFREKIRVRPDKRKQLLDLIGKRLSVVKYHPLVLVSWLSLVAFEDIPTLAELTSLSPEHLIQSVMYRLKTSEECTDSRQTQLNVEQSEKVLSHILMAVEKEKERMAESGNMVSIFLSSISVLKRMCRMVRLVPEYKAALLSYQLVLKVAEILDATQKKQCQDDEQKNINQQKLLHELKNVQQHVNDWRDGLLRNPLLSHSNSLSYPKEIEVWSSLLKVECCVEGVSTDWLSSVEKDFRKRITTASDEDVVVVCCLESSVASIGRSHHVLQTCFSELCQAAIKRICQAEKEGGLMWRLASLVKDLPVTVLSTIVVESAARFQNPVFQLLSPGSAINHLLSQGDWKAIKVDDAAGQVIEGSQNSLALLVEALCRGTVQLGDLQPTLKFKEEFKKLYRQYKKHNNMEGFPFDMEGVLAQREAEMNSFNQQWRHMDTLIKMIRKITETIAVAELSTLEDKQKGDLRSVQLNKLVLVRPFRSNDKPKKPVPGQVLWYDTTESVQDMACHMHKLYQSSLILTSWARQAGEVAARHQPGSTPLQVTLAQVYDVIWTPVLTGFRDLGLRIARSSVTFGELDKTLLDIGDQGDGKQVERELRLMSELLGGSQGPALEPKWIELRLGQIQEYRRLHEAAAAASAVLKIAARMKLSGDFSEISTLTQMKEDTFQRRDLGSLTDDLIRAKKQLSTVTVQHTECLEVFLESHALVTWVRNNLRNMSDVKVFVDLASISAGENDREIDQVACFHDAVMGYSPLFFSLPTRAGYNQFLTCARQVWDALHRDEKLPDKLRESTRLLSWLKGLKETHGSVEQSSLSLASAINAQGVYHIGQTDGDTKKRCVQDLLLLRVKKGYEVRSYSLDDLLELQNKLMLMSSKGEHGKEQVNRFTQVFEGVQRLSTVLLQMQTSGNMLFREWQAEVQCRAETQPCIQVTFSLMQGKKILYYGEVTDKLQELCQSMEICHKEWCSLISEKRSQFHCLNHYTSEQMVYLCHWVHNVCHTQTSVPQQFWYLLSPIHSQCTPIHIRKAFAKATNVPFLDDEEVNFDDDEDYDDFDYEDSQSTGSREIEDEVENLITFSSGDEDENVMADDEDNPMDFSRLTPGDAMEDGGINSIEGLWTKFRDNMPRYLNKHLDVSTLAHCLSHLSDMSQHYVKRKLPPALQEGKPNVIVCSATEVFTTALSLYMESPEQPLPSTDEVLVCKEETTEEEVEIFLRRALSQDSQRIQQRIYTLVNPGLLGYDVSMALGELFDHLERSANSRYRLVIVSPVQHQHRYVPSFFSNHKVQAGVDVAVDNAKNYLRHHLAVPLRSPASKVYPDQLSAWIVSSARPAVGKSLYVDRLFEKFQGEFCNAKHVRIRLIEPRVDADALVKTLAPLREQDPVLLHIDTAAVRSGLEELLFHLLILSCLSDSQGMLWRRNRAHLIAVELLRSDIAPQNQPKEKKLGLLDIAPTICCRSPKMVKQFLLENRGTLTRQSLDPLMDEQEFSSEGIQRPYLFLKCFSSKQNLDPLKYKEGSTIGNPVDCLYYLLAYCGMQDPSWTELKNFTWFLNVQLKDCENSMFCDPDFLADQLPGFKGFIVKFMILMARDFASPSMQMSDESPLLHFENNPEDDILARLTIRKHWENEAHPYIFFNADRSSMSFFGFHVKMSPNGRTLNAVDPSNNKQLIGDVMTLQIFNGLERQNISLTEDFNQLERPEKIKRISRVVGAKKGMTGDFDPDPTYELTADNVMKMLAIYMRFRCGIPVIIMGETGCGKTRLVRFLCDLQREGRAVENMKLVKVHGGTTAEMIHRKVREAEILAEKNRRAYKIDTILFFDEANTTESLYAIKEILCDSTVQGHPLKADSGLRIIAACNPYRRHSHEMVERLERAGLGYRVKAEETEERLGKVPLRQLVYRVHPLPPSMASLVWDFGQLSDSAEFSYITQIVEKKVEDHNLPVACESVISNVLAASQKFMRSRKNECSFVSLRDVERSMKVLVWFYEHSRDLFPNANELNSVQMTLKCLVLAVGVCYYPSLVSKENYLSAISRYFPNVLGNAEALHQEISSCQDFFLQNIQTRETIAKNIALKENVFLMVVCIELRIPLFLVGKPGSSKSLAKTVVADAMQGQNSHCELFKKLKQVHMVSFQCSPHSSPEGIIGTFRNCARFQKDKNMDEYVSVVVLDEIGLAEDSTQMPLKTLHPLLEDGCIDNDRPDPHMKVGFVGISNWALDPAKMNRGIFVSRWDPSEDELVETAKGICSSSNPILLKIKHLFPPLAKAFLSICEETSKNQFFGLRDYYSLVKMLFGTVKSTNEEPDGKQLLEAILRNFSGQPEGFDPVIFFQEVSQNFSEVPRPSTLQMVEKNLDRDNSQECRYLLLLTTNNAALHILQQRIFAKEDHTPPEIVFGSGFPKDQEYAQICRNVNRVKTCMETGRTVILLNMQNLYESLYDALNQYYVYLSNQQYVDLGLGSHRVKCRVHKDFRLVVVEDQRKVYEHFPVPLINRLEKHRVDRSTDLTPWQRRVLDKLMDWVKEFSGTASGEFELSDTFIGFHRDACASALLQALERRAQQMGNNNQQQQDENTNALLGKGETNEQGNPIDGKQETVVGEESDRVLDAMEIDQENNEPRSASAEKIEETLMEVMEDGTGLNDISDKDMNKMEIDHMVSSARNEDEEVFELAKCFLVNCATPDSVLRLKYSDLAHQEKERLQKLYFLHQRHHTLQDFMEHHLSEPNKSSKFLEVTTFSSLLTRADVRVVSQALGLASDRILLLSLHQFDTEASFCNKIQSFLKDTGSSLRVLLIQMDIEESKSSDELIASAKYCTTNYVMSLQAQTCCVVFITKLSRIPSGSQYIGFQGGVWQSVHIDDLRDTKDMSLNLSAFCGTLISKLLYSAPSAEQNEMETKGEAPDTAVNLKGEMAHLHSLSLVRSCIQKAVALLRDPSEVTSRSMPRIHILLELLRKDQGHMGAHFQEILLERLALALAQKEEMMPAPRDWVNKEARKRQALQEGGTLRHALWRHLQSTLTPILAAMVETLDRYANLNMLLGAGLSQGLVQLWLDIMADTQILDLTPPQHSSMVDQEVLVQHYIMLEGKVQPCQAPFSWLINVYVDSLWEEYQFVPVTDEGSKQTLVQFVSTFSSSRVGSYLQKLSEQEKTEYGQRYLEDFLLLRFKIKSRSELQVFTKAMWGCMSGLQRSMGATLDLSPAWVLAASKHYGPRLDTLSHILLLQPQLAADVLQQGLQKEHTDMVEDILALGICVEGTRLLTVTSLEECDRFVHRVELLQPCLDRAFGRTYSDLCSPACLNGLESIRSTWRRMQLVAAFILHVMFEVKQKDSTLQDLTLKHCSLLLNLMQDCADLQSVETLEKLIRILNSYHDECISRDLRYGVNCPVCLSEFKEPCVLPCDHVLCLSCIQQSVQTGRHICPKCREHLPPDFTPTVSPNIKVALQQHADVKARCNTFFLEAVSHFCLSEGERPNEDVVKLLFSLLISSHGDVYKTRELTPFLECVDKSPVVRSVLPKLLLQHSFDQVKGHIQSYLLNLEENILAKEDRTELYLLFVNCLQDSLLCSEARRDKVVDDGCRRLQQEVSFLSRLARGQTQRREEEPVEFLLNMARIRLCLASAARLLSKVTTEAAGCGEAQEQYLRHIRAVCQYCGHDWYRVYLLRTLHRQAGMDCVLTLMNSSYYQWAFPPEVLRQQRMIPAVVDRFLCCGPSYRALRDGVVQVLMENTTEPLEIELKKLRGSKATVLVFLTLALFRQVTCRLISSKSLRPTAQGIKQLEELLKQVTSGELRDFCSGLLANQVGRPGSSPLQTGPDCSGQRRILLDLLVHTDAVLLSGSPLLVPLRQIAFQPRNVPALFLPTMADDHTSEAQQLLTREGHTQMYYCMNGHACFVGECGRPVVISACPECGVPVGGQNHSPVVGFTRAEQRVGDQTRTGHILGVADRRSDVPERQTTQVQSAVLRLLTHLSMLQGALTNRQGISEMIHPRTPDVLDFLWRHLEKDLEVLGHSLDQNMDDTAIIVQLILNRCLEFTAGSRHPVPDLSSKQGRQQWEKQLCDCAINPVVQNLRPRLCEARDLVSADDRLGGSPVMMLLYGDPGPMLSSSDCPTHQSSFWNVPETLTVERFTQLVGQAPDGSVPLLTLFLKKVQCVRQLHHLPELAGLLSDLLRVFPLVTETTHQTITQTLNQIAPGCQRKRLRKRVKRFMDVWNSLRVEVSNSAELGVEKHLCEQELTMESSGEFLMPCRRGPGSCLRTLVDFLTETHNGLVREARKLSHQDDSDYSVPLDGVSETQLTLCHPEKELLPLALSHCHYTLKKGRETVSSYNLPAVQSHLACSFLAGKPLIQADTSKYLNRHLQDFSVVLSEVRDRIPQEPLKGSASGAVRAVLRSYADACDAVTVVETGLRFLGKTGGTAQEQLLAYLQDSLKMGLQISASTAKALGESKLQHSVFTWQLLTCWKSELMLNKNQEPFQRLPSEFQQKLSADERKGLKSFFTVTDVETFSLELHEILHLKTTNATLDQNYPPRWDIRSTLESHLEQKKHPPLPGLEALPEDITLEKGAEVWKMAIGFRKR